MRHPRPAAHSLTEREWRIDFQAGRLPLASPLLSLCLQLEERLPPGGRRRRVAGRGAPVPLGRAGTSAPSAEAAGQEAEGGRTTPDWDGGPAVGGGCLA
jgi:hypothetical protein